MAQPPRDYAAGEQIPLDPDVALEVLEGIVALTVLHEDGAKVLLGIYGPGQVLAGHPEGACCVQLHAHLDARVWVQPWAEAARRPGFAERLRDRLHSMEAWVAVQTRPRLEERVLGLLSLLAEQFGRPTSRGMLIEVRITQSQLAEALGATRTTVSRLLGRLRRRGLLIALRASRGERYYLQGGEKKRHAPEASIFDKCV